MSRVHETLRLLSPLKRVDLQRLAVLIGAPLTGTKAQLSGGICEATCQNIFSTHGPDLLREGRSSVRVLSIDMGIRNLAFALLEQELSHSDPDRSSLPVPKLCDWQRIDVSGSSATLRSGGPAESESIEAAVTNESQDFASRENLFEPNIMAPYAYRLVKHFTSLKPTHVIIERQRFRTGGHAAVQEWSLRVGMMEAMLYATLSTLRSENLCDILTLGPVLPMRVNKYWFRDVDIPATGKQAKIAKIELIREILRTSPGSDQIVTLGSRASAGAKNFADKGVGKKSKVFDTTSKLDDLSDSLLQGLAWLHWQHNRQRLLTEGPKFLESH